MSAPYSIRETDSTLYYKDAVEQVSARIPHGLRCSGLITLPEPECADADALVAAAVRNPLGPPLCELATGVHRGASPEEIAAMTGRFAERLRVVNHILRLTAVNAEQRSGRV